MDTNTFPDHAANAVLELYDSLGKKGKPHGKEWVVVSGIVLKTQHVDDYDLEVLSLGTGNKCMSSTKLSGLGDVIHDSHAEVISKRAFRLFLYQEIHGLYTNGSSMIFDLKENLDIALKPNISFHMYVSHAPCGDASIFPEGLFEGTPGGSKPVEGVVDQLYSDQYGLLRRKPGRGVPCLSMSCTDKICRWQILGLQGNILSNIIPPIFLSSIIIGDYFYAESAYLGLKNSISLIQNTADFQSPNLHIFSTQYVFSRGKLHMTDTHNTNTLPSSSNCIYKYCIGFN
eukprot:TRINITY_DN3487_c0_g1_i3.p1 TRINITY_DN3487_c0_g1~~TRINITY_DN3487_c0_g1_i3.p1  ORF type:complete len:286 (+),score=51.81 TRINITY_DN3487_c0_g1_i3:27-884(+)